MPNNVEIKARVKDLVKFREILLENGANCKGTDEQKDTYFNVSEGRLKLREGTIENNLIYYQRENEAKAKLSEVLLHKPSDNGSLKAILGKVLGVSISVVKSREIYYKENVKFHLDTVEGLGYFVEIEAINTDGSFSKEKLAEQCQYYQDLFGIDKKDLEAYSYSDLLFQSRLGNKDLLKFH